MAEPVRNQNDQHEPSLDRLAGAASVGALDVTQAIASNDLFEIDDQAERLVAVLDEYLSQLAIGEAPDHDALLAANPDLKEQLTDCLAGLKFIHGATAAGSSPEHRLLGDFRIIREVGHGGMGAVYEAQQISLGRRVALKILRFGSVSDPEAIQRFQREAETVAKLHHTNIVPIFASGTEQSVNYYAMQFIDGQSLDQVLRKRTERGELLAPEVVAQWGLQAAEALAHAHARGVIHRDVKPSNLLIDNEEGRIWLTDFGLAKCLDDVTLSMTGALLGTPRYMSPEQAAAAHQRLDHRTDIYSLGATLYELVTGQPLFQGDSAHQVISQILTADPRPPRRLRPELPRDLETILMKCLSKDAAQRYETARQLVSDLRAFLDGRPIAARRASTFERTSRWIKRQKRSVALTAGAIAATLMLVLFTWIGNHLWQRSRLAFVMLRTDRPPLIAELLINSKQVVPPVTVPTQQRLEVPSGDYQLQLFGDGRLSQSYDLSLTPGDHFQHKLDLDDQLLWGDVQLQRTFELGQFRADPAVPARNAEDVEDSSPLAANNSPPTSWVDVICLTNDGLSCLSGGTSRERWALNLLEPQHDLLKQGQLNWPWDRFVTSSSSRGIGKFDDRPMLISQGNVTSSDSMDFDSDGISDLVLATRSQACLLAISGRDGNPLWIVARDGDGNVPAIQRSIGDIRPHLASVLYPPQPVADQNNDGVTDLLTVFITLKNENATPQRTVELISGASGKSIWRYEIPAEYFQLPPNKSIPYELQWFCGSGGGYSSSGGGFALENDYVVRQHGHLERSGTHHFMPTRPTIIRSSQTPSDGEQTVALRNAVDQIVMIASQQLIQIDLQTGYPVSEAAGQPKGAEFALSPAIQPVFADLDADHETDMLLLLEPSSMSADADGNLLSESALAAWSMKHRRVLWKREIAASIPRQSAISVPRPEWPLALDLDGDGAAEVLIPNGTSADRQSRNSAPWGGLMLLDGRTGEPRWQRRLQTMDQSLEHYAVGPDVDQDGVRDVFVAALWSVDGSHHGTSLFVDCLSGADGHTIWRAQQSQIDRDAGSASYLLSNLSWYAPGSDGWPQLIVPLRRNEGEVLDRTYLISAGTGRVMHSAIDTTQMDVADLDADGIDDLLLFRRQNFAEWDQGGTLQAVRGVGSEAWRKLIATPLTTVGDLDGDGVRDLVTQQSPGHFEAISGKTGIRLWHTSLTPQLYSPLTIQSARQHDLSSNLFAPQHDLNGDGTADVLLVSQRANRNNVRPLITALSGLNGRMLWQSEAGAQVISSVCWLDCRDLDGDGLVEIVMVVAADYGAPAKQSFGSGDARLWLVVISGSTGLTKWAEPLTLAMSDSNRHRYRFESTALEATYADLDNDGILDIVLPAQGSSLNSQLEMRGISGKDGHSLWRLPLPIEHNVSEALANVAPSAAADIDADGRPEVVVMSLAESRTTDGQVKNRVQLELLDGATGTVRWQWQTPGDHWGNQAIHFQHRMESRPRPLLIRRTGGGYWIAVRLWNTQQELHVLDEHGNAVSQLTQQGSYEHESDRLWALDTNADGADELLLLSRSGLMLLQPEQLDVPLWIVVGSKSRLQRVVDVLPNFFGPPTIVVQGDTNDRSLHGIDSTTGKVQWSCAGPMSQRSLPDQLQVELLNVPSAKMPPHALYQFASKALVRRAVRLTQVDTEAIAMGDFDHQSLTVTRTANVAADGLTVTPWQSFARREAKLVPLTNDPRLLRRLPWKPSDYELQRMPTFLSWCAFYGITLVTAPVTLLILLRRQHRWNWYSLLALIVVSTTVLLGVRIDGPDHDFQTLPRKLSIALLGASPIIFTVVNFGFDLCQGRWRGFVRWLIIAMVTTAGLMLVWIAIQYWYDADNRQLGERYEWTGWYWLAPPVFYLAACAFFLASFGSWLMRATFGLLTRRREDAQTAPR